MNLAELPPELTRADSDKRAMYVWTDGTDTPPEIRIPLYSKLEAHPMKAEDKPDFSQPLLIKCAVYRREATSGGTTWYRYQGDRYE